jgi:hypothetical protein
MYVRKYRNTSSMQHYIYTIPIPFLKHRLITKYKYKAGDTESGGSGSYEISLLNMTVKFYR